MLSSPTPASPGIDPERFTQLDAMRFVFALVVATVHTLGFRHTLVHGAFAVDFFFALSGFVLTHALIRRPAGLVAFSWARFARLYPLHILALFWLVCLWGLPPPPSPYYPAFFLNLAMLQGLGLVGVHVWNFPAWSVSVEFLVNILVLYPLVRTRSITAAMGLAALALAALLHRVGPGFDRFAIEPFYGPLISAGLLRGVIGILVGYLLYEAHLFLAPRLRPARYLGPATAFEVLAIATLGFALWVDHPLGHLLPIPLSAALILQMATVPGRLSQLLRTGPFPGLGDISYSIYLLHFPLFSVFVAAGLLPIADSGLSPVWFVYLALLLGVSAVSFRYFERPAQRWLMLQFRRWRPARPLASDDGAPS